MTQPFRVGGGTEIDRDQPLAFTFDGRKLEGFAGDTLASALLANGVRLVGRSLKYHRPRGIAGNGPEEPNALVEIDGRPNLRATEVLLREGLAARSQNAWPSLRFDLLAAAGWIAPLLPAGFQNKTFKWPRRFWPFYERVLRRMAGLGRAPRTGSDETPLLRHAHVDVLVVGGGPAGLAAAESASREGARVLLAEAGPVFGGRLRDLPPEQRPGLAGDIEELRQRRGLRLLSHASVLGAYDHGLWTIAEQMPGAPARLWLVRARATVLATGTIERPLPFPGNDRPGVMLASAVRGYLHRQGVLCGRRPLLVGADDGVYALALELAAAGADVVGVVDPREPASGAGPNAARAAGIPILAGQQVARVLGGRQVTGARLRRHGVPRLGERLRCDLIAVHGGWTPAAHLYAQARGRLAWDEDRGAMLPAGPTPSNLFVIGAAAGEYDLGQTVAAAATAGAMAAGLPVDAPLPPLRRPAEPVPPLALPQTGWARSFVDPQNDVTLADLALAAREGYGTPELAKRYTALGMGTDQGKQGGAIGAAVLAHLAGVPAGTLGPTTFRPPWVPVDAPVLAAGAAMEAFRPLRRSAVDDWHAAHGATFGEAGGWRRPVHYDGDAAIRMEALALLRTAGIVDLGPIGRLVISGRDAEALLARACCCNIQNLAVGRMKRVLLLRDDGRVLAIALLAHTAPTRYLLTVPAGQDAAVYEHLTLMAETRWPGLAVHIVPVTEQWFGFALVGPRSRALLFDLTGDIDVGNAAFPPLSVRHGTVAGVTAEVTSHRGWGEPAFEVAVPADQGLAVWNAVLAAGQRHRLRACGTAALDLLRIVAGRPGGGEIDGRTTPLDLGFALPAIPPGGPEPVGRRAFVLPALADPMRLQLVGLAGLDPTAPIPTGAQLVAERKPGAQPILGHVTAHGMGPERGAPVGLALLAGGRGRIGETLFATSPLLDAWSPVRIIPPGAGELPLERADA